MIAVIIFPNSSKTFYFLSHLRYNKKQLTNCKTYKWRFSFGCQILKLHSGHCQPPQYDESGRRLVCLSVLPEPVSFQTGAGSSAHLLFTGPKVKLSLTSAGMLYVEAPRRSSSSRRNSTEYCGTEPERPYPCRSHFQLGTSHAGRDHPAIPRTVSGNHH